MPDRSPGNSFRAASRIPRNKNQISRINSASRNLTRNNKCNRSRITARGGEIGGNVGEEDKWDEEDDARKEEEGEEEVPQAPEGNPHRGEERRRRGSLGVPHPLSAAATTGIGESRADHQELTRRRRRAVVGPSFRGGGGRSSALASEEEEGARRRRRRRRRWRRWRRMALGGGGEVEEENHKGDAERQI